MGSELNCQNYYDGPVWNAFGLGRASYFVAPRQSLQRMPREWQERFVSLMEEAHATLPEEAFPDNYIVTMRANGKFARDPLSNYRYPERTTWASG